MQTYATGEVARKLGITRVTLQRYIAKKLITPPPARTIGGLTVREWTDADIRRVRQQLPGNGRRAKKAQRQK